MYTGHRWGAKISNGITIGAGKSVIQDARKFGRAAKKVGGVHKISTHVPDDTQEQHEPNVVAQSAIIKAKAGRQMLQYGAQTVGKAAVTVLAAPVSIVGHVANVLAMPFTAGPHLIAAGYFKGSKLVSGGKRGKLVEAKPNSATDEQQHSIEREESFHKRMLPTESSSRTRATSRERRKELARKASDHMKEVRSSVQLHREVSAHFNMDVAATGKKVVEKAKQKRDLLCIKLAKQFSLFPIRAHFTS
jgi:hypothetical protein